MPDTPATPRPHIVVIGGSAGGLDAVRELVPRLPGDLDAAVFVVLHIPASPASSLARLIDRWGPLPARAATDLAPIEPETITVAPADHHLLVKPEWVRVVRGPRENGHRPAIDPLLRSAAASHGDAVTATIVSGALDDGAAGAHHVVEHGGRVLVQDPDEARYGDMPDHVRSSVEVEAVLPAGHLADAIVEAVTAPLGPHDPILDPDPVEGAEQVVRDPGPDDVFACPNCGGPLSEESTVASGGPLHFRCRVGHAWSMESLRNEQRDELEQVLWSAVRVLNERAALMRRLTERGGQRGHHRAEAVYRLRAQEAMDEATRLQHLIRDGMPEEAIGTDATGAEPSAAEATVDAET